MNFFFRKWSAVSKRIRDFLFRNAKGTPSATPIHETPIIQFESKKRSRSNANSEIRNFKTGILDSLDEYFFYLKRMKAGDPAGYSIMTKIGGTLWKESPRLEPNVLLSKQHLEPIWEKSRPSFHYAFFPKAYEGYEKKDKDNIYFVVASFNKVKGMSHILPLPGKDIYEVCLVYDKKNDKKIKNPIFVQFSVGLEKCGRDIVLLKSIVDCPIKIKSKLGPKHARGSFVVQRRKWGYSPSLCAIAEDSGRTPEQAAREIFCILANGYAFSGNAMISITASKKGMCAKFSIDPTESKVFFEDREIILNDKGTKAKIFHSVKAHTRSNGSAVRFHFKGLKSFVWNGYKINIRIPGRDTGRLYDFDATQFEEGSKAIANKEAVAIEDVASELARKAA